MHPECDLLKFSLCKLVKLKPFVCLNGSVSSEVFNQEEQKTKVMNT